MLTGLFIYSINGPATHFPCLLFQTRDGDELVRETGQGGRSEQRLHHEPHSSCVPADEPQSPLHAAGNDTHSPLLTSAMPVREVLSAGIKYSQATFQPGLDDLNRRR